VTGFADYLQKFINLKEITLKDLSEETNIDRTVLYRYIKGKRIPSNKDVVIRMADAAQMSVKEKKYLLEEYDKLVIGENVVYSYKYIKKMMHNLGQLEKKDVPASNLWYTVHEFKMENEVISFQSKEEIITYILDLFKYIVSSRGGVTQILLFMQPVYDDIQKFIPQIFKDSNIEIEQIICMEQNINQNYKNLELLEKVLPSCFSIPGYSLFYYYDILSNHINSMTVMPNIIIADDYVVMFNYDMGNGTVIKNKVFSEAIRNEYYLLKRETRRLVINGKKAACNNFIMDSTDEKLNICLQKQFCLKNCLGRDLLEKHICQCTEKEYFIDRLVSTYGDWTETGYIYKNNANPLLVSYGTAEGMEEFIKNGTIKEFYGTFCSPLAIEERMMVLERMIFIIKSGKAIYFLISSEVELPNNIIFYLNESKKRFVLNWVTETNIIQGMVDEQSIYRTFRVYLEYLDKKGMLYSEEETVTYLENLKKQLRVNKNFF